MLIREYRIPMPLTVEEYKIGQLYMIAKHSAEQSHDGEGVEVVENRPHEDPVHGKGQYTEKRIHLSSRLPSWIKAFVPRIFYVTEKAWNYYPFTLTEYTCSFAPRFSIYIKTCYKNDPGTTDNSLDLTEEQLKDLEVDMVDIVNDQVAAHHYKEKEDLRNFKSGKTGRGPYENEGWLIGCDPVMCSYKSVEVKIEIMGITSRVESYVHSCIREILLVGHRQAVAWLDDWYGMTLEDVREYENQLQAETNKQFEKSDAVDGGGGSGSSSKATTPTTPSSGSKKGWFSSWSFPGSS